MEENKVVKATTNVIGKVDGNLKVVGITVIGTLAVAALGSFAVKKCKEAIQNHKLEKEKIVINR